MNYFRLRNLTVDFPIYQGGSRSLKKTLLRSSSKGNLARDGSDRINVRALSDLSFDIREGDRVALIGPNGAGKTTLLKVLAGIYEPTFGSIKSSGKICSLLNVTVGLNVDATGFENIAIRGMYLDIHPKEMRRHVEDIVEFTELGDYMNMPVRTYSAGMMLRLAFAISTCVHPEILLMDEWIAAGDAGFLAKAQKRLAAFVSNSSILVLASHSNALLEQWCSKGIILKGGNLHAIGGTKDMLDEYQRTFS